MKIVIFYNEESIKDGSYAKVAKKFMETFKAVEVLVCCVNFKNIQMNFNLKDCDFIIVIGGDGTIIRFAKLICGQDKPILGINSGRLGFLASLEKSDIKNLEKLILGEYFFTKRMMISAKISGQEKTRTALNDIVIHRGSYSQIMDFKVSKNKETICKFRADGVIVATPTGSTAYSLSAGGPIVEQSAECIILTPVCPHSMSVRPLIFDADGEVEIEFVPRNSSEAVISCDGEILVSVGKSGTLKVKKSENFVNMVNMYGQNFYENIDKKLN